MKIVLKNGENVDLDWNPIVLEYLEDYEGGIGKLIEDIKDETCRFKTFNFVIYSMLLAIYPKELSYRQAVSLVNINDYEHIADFIISNFENTNIDEITYKKHRR